MHIYARKCMYKCMYVCMRMCMRMCMCMCMCMYVCMCIGYKHYTLIYKKMSLPLSVRGAYIATTAPYLNIWCL